MKNGRAEKKSRKKKGKSVTFQFNFDVLIHQRVPLVETNPGISQLSSEYPAVVRGATIGNLDDPGPSL